jgi:Zn-dependent membrane protease YugP
MYWIILGFTFLLSMGAMAYLKSVYARTAQVPIASGLTGAQTAARILQSATTTWKSSRATVFWGTITTR